MIAFIAAEIHELRGLERHLKNRRRIHWPVQYAVTGYLNDRLVVLAANGPGPQLAGQALDLVRARSTRAPADKWREVAASLTISSGGIPRHAHHGESEFLDAIVSFGFCGALDPGLVLADIFVATEVIGAGPAAVPFSPRPPHCFGKLLSLDYVVISPEEKELLSRTGAAAVEMEAGALAARALEWEVPFYCIYAVTDTASEGFGIDFNAMRDASGRFSRWKIVAAACRAPWKLVPELAALERRCKQASIVLGDFIADCQF